MLLKTKLDSQYVFLVAWLVKMDILLSVSDHLLHPPGLYTQADTKDFPWVLWGEQDVILEDPFVLWRLYLEHLQHSEPFAD